MEYPTYRDQQKILLEIVKPYFDYYNNAIINSNENVETKKLRSQLKKMDVKKRHSFDMAIDGLQVSKSLKIFSEELVLVSQTNGLLHDIGRFEQMYTTGKFVDKDSFGDGKYRYGVKDHGELGKVILLNDGKIRLFFPTDKTYDNLIGNVVGKHVSFHDHIKIDRTCSEFNNYSVKELSKNDELMNKLISWQVQIVQDTDRLDILKQVQRGDFVPETTQSPIKLVSEEAKQKFYNCEFINIGDVKSKNLWTGNTGELVRWSFVYQTNLVSTLKRMHDLNLLENIWNKKPIDELKDEYQFIIELRDLLISSSDDGIYVNKDKAKELIKR